MRMPVGTAVQRGNRKAKTSDIRDTAGTVSWPKKAVSLERQEQEESGGKSRWKRGQVRPELGMDTCKCSNSLWYWLKEWDFLAWDYKWRGRMGLGLFGCVLPLFSLLFTKHCLMDVCIPSSPLPGSTFRPWLGSGKDGIRRTMYMESDLSVHYAGLNMRCRISPNFNEILKTLLLAS